jgi:hypothetical protein
VRLFGRTRNLERALLKYRPKCTDPAFVNCWKLFIAADWISNDEFFAEVLKRIQDFDADRGYEELQYDQEGFIRMEDASLCVHFVRWTGQCSLDNFRNELNLFASEWHKSAR